ncbi:MAG: 30S ribosomal protein S3 [Candidatus Omnitrophica bacterium]|nr:30S ribosomal protein S3 [Candidatus Omnitrophota bacterium]
MGQKVNPIGLRLGITEKWRSLWFADNKNFKNFLKEDVLTKNYLIKRFPRGSITRIEIEKISEKIRIILYSPRPGVVLGRRGAEINQVRDELIRRLNVDKKHPKQVSIDVEEVKSPVLSAQFVADTIAMQLERRVPHRVVIKKEMALSRGSGAPGIKVKVGGRLGGAEISRSELYIDGKVPLHTLRAKIDYATSTAVTKFGCIGVKVWIFLKEVLGPETSVKVEKKSEKKDEKEKIGNTK